MSVRERVAPPVGRSRAGARAPQAAYEQHRGYVLGELARRFSWLDPDEREALFHDAYALMLERQRDGVLSFEAMKPYEVRAYLARTAIYKALDEEKRAERRRTRPIDERALAEPDSGAPPDDVAAAKFEGAVVKEILAELPARRQAVVKLRFFFERTPEEIQAMLAISSRVYRRELERGVRHIGERYELVRAGTYCDSRRAMILAYVAGSAQPGRESEAREHLAHCPGCRHWAAELRAATRQVAGVVPLPLAIEEGATGRLGEFAATAWEGLGNLVAGGKQHAAALIMRLDPGAAGYATAARPGTMAAVVSGCIVAGGGATYCAVQVGVPVDALFSRIDSTKAEPRGEGRDAVKPEVKSEPQPRAVIAPPQPSRVAAAPRPTPQPTPKSEPAPEPAPEPEPAQQQSPAPTEFGLEGATESVPPAASAPAASSESAQSASEPAAAPGEFDP